VEAGFWARFKISEDDGEDDTQNKNNIINWIRNCFIFWPVKPLEEVCWLENE
jgi:hypothetical protein